MPLDLDKMCGIGGGAWPTSQQPTAQSNSVDTCARGSLRERVSDRQARAYDESARLQEIAFLLEKHPDFTDLLRLLELTQRAGLL